MAGANPTDQTFTVDTTQFNRMMNHLAKNTGVSVRKVIRGECERVLSKACDLTKVAKKGLIRRKYTLKGRDNEWARDKEWPFKWNYGPKQDPMLMGELKMGGKKVRLRKIAKADLPKVRKALHEKRDAKLKHVGLAKSTWITLGRKLNLQPRITNKTAMAATKASAKYNSQCKAKDNGVADGDSGYGIELNVSTDAAAEDSSDMAYALKQAMNGREKYFKTNLSKDVFSDTEKIKKQYGFI